MYTVAGQDPPLPTAMVGGSRQSAHAHSTQGQHKHVQGLAVLPHVADDNLQGTEHAFQNHSV
jgi:hypothetical protein